jgi:hypothetical protein
VLAELISTKSTKQPQTLAELTTKTGLRQSEVKLCLTRLESKGLVRPLDATRRLWEISHDCVAKQFAILLGQLRPNPWPTVAMWTTPVLFVLTLGALLYVTPLYFEHLEQLVFTELQKQGASISAENGTTRVRFEHVDNAGLVAAARFIARYNAPALDLNGTEVTDLTPLLS